MGLFDFGKKPQWAEELPPHIQLTASQIKELEEVRSELGESHQGFHWHIATHPEGTKMLQRAMYQMLKAQYPKEGDTLLLARIIWTRLMTAMMQGQDLFGLSGKVLMGGAQPTAAELQVIVDYMNQRKLLTLEAVAEAIVREEEQLPNNVPPAPQAAAAVKRVSEILRHSQ